MNFKIEAAKIVIKECDKQIKKYTKERSKIKDEAIAKLPELCVFYKGEKYSTYEDLQDAYGCDMFNMSTFEKLQKKLEELQELYSEAGQTELIDTLIKYWTNIRKQAYDVIEVEEMR